MQNSNFNMIKLAMNNIEDLFNQPDYDPFDPSSRFGSGFDEILNQARKRSFKKPLQIMITLSSPVNDPDLNRRVEKAIKRFCTENIKQIGLELTEIREQGKRDLGWALSFSLILLLGAFLITQLTILPDFLIYLLSTGAGIIAWVVLWPPLDNLLYEWRPYRRSQLVYQQIQSAEIEIHAINSEL